MGNTKPEERLLHIEGIMKILSSLVPHIYIFCMQIFIVAKMMLFKIN